MARRLSYSGSAADTTAEDVGQVDIGLAVSPDERWLAFTRIDRKVDNIMLVENFR
jgi:hypothetical protein